MKKFKSPLGIDFAGPPLAAVAVHLLLAVLALALTAALWLGATRSSRDNAAFRGVVTSANARHVDLPPVLVVGHREGGGGRRAVEVAGLSSDCANGSAPQAAREGRIPVTLQQ
jgi:hypothetical protein